MELRFRKWLTEMTSTADIAGFSRPVMGVVRRSWLGPWGEEDPFFRRSKKKRLDEGVDRMGAKRRIPDGAIKVHLPKVRQQRSYSCGAAVFSSVCRHFGIQCREESLIEELKSGPRKGTLPKTIIEVAKKYGLQVRQHVKMSVDHLKAYLDEQIPIICAVQAYGNPDEYQSERYHGHYVVAIGYDKDNNIYFEDPLSPGVSFLPKKDFVSRWHDNDFNGNAYVRLGIAIWADENRNAKRKITRATEMP